MYVCIVRVDFLRIKYSWTKPMIKFGVTLKNRKIMRESKIDAISWMLVCETRMHEYCISMEQWPSSITSTMSVHTDASLTVASRRSRARCALFFRLYSILYDAHYAQRTAHTNRDIICSGAASTVLGGVLVFTVCVRSFSFSVTYYGVRSD
jgi:hypothetical protein